MEIVYSVLSFLVGLGVIMPYVLQLQKVLKESAELIETVSKAPDDGISASDLADIKKEAKDVWDAIKGFKGLKK